MEIKRAESREHGVYQELFDKYPHLLYKEESRYAMQLFGFETGKSWFPVIKEAIEKIDAYLKENPIEGFFISQVKSKFAHLCIYYQGWDEEINKIIAEAESKCSKICEFCDQPGDRCSPRGWIYIACDNHKEQLKTKYPRDLD